MNPRWLIAKYMGDLTRRETRNVGIIVLAQDRCITRFLGEAEGEIDGRRVRKVVNSLETYKAWCEYWRHAATMKTPDELVRRLDDANYFLEWGGEVVFSKSAESPENLVDQLFERVVATPTSEAHTPKALARALFDRLNISHQVERDYVCQVGIGQEDGGLFTDIKFDFAYQNGKRTLMKSMAVGGKSQFQKVQATAWEFERVSGAPDVGDQLVALVETVTPGNIALAQKAVLSEAHASVIDVTHEDSAVHELAGLLRLKP